MKKASLLLLVLFAIGAFGLISCKKDSNKNPVITSVTVNPASVNANGTVSVAVVASDPDNDQLSYSYTVTGGAINGTGPNITWTAPSTAGAHTINVTVSDGKGGTATGNGALTVLPAVTQITGTAQFPAGVSGDLANSKVSIYTSYDNWNANQPIKFAAVTGTGASVSFSLTNVNPGNYYLDVWKDNDNNAFWSSGDFIGWYGSGGLGSPILTEFQIAEGQTVNLNVQMFIVAKSSPTGTKTGVE
ncbi:MAG: hypothetical protein H3C41_07775 [Bacteroidales bacterium]|nr:hypothetical protein [Bacteroidales bacterium]